jgi:hypothetical protein
MIIGQALSSFDGEGVGQIVVFIKSTYSSAGYSIKDQSLLLGDISSLENGLSDIVSNIESEISRDPSVIIGQKISDSKQFLTDFISARITAIRGYFNEIFTKKIHTDKLCLKKSDGNEICVDGDQVQNILGGNSSPTLETPISQEVPIVAEPTSNMIQSTSSEQVSEEVASTTESVTEQIQEIMPVPDPVAEIVPTETSTTEQTLVEAPVEIQQ